MVDPNCLIIKQPSAPLRDAFDTLSSLHDIADAHPRTIRGTSRKSCAFSARTSAEFLQRVGFADARTACCVLFVIEFDKNKKPIGREKIGEFKNSGTLDADGLWHGHMVVIVGDYVFDPTAGQIKIASFPTMIASPLHQALLQGQPTISALGLKREAERYLELYWLEAPGSWAEDMSDLQWRVSSEIAAELAWRHSSLKSSAVVPRSTISC